MRIQAPKFWRLMTFTQQGNWAIFSILMGTWIIALSKSSQEVVGAVMMSVLYMGLMGKFDQLRERKEM